MGSKTSSTKIMIPFNFVLISFLGILLLGLLLSPAIAVSSEKGVTLTFKKATRKLDPDSQVKASIPLPRDIVRSNVDYQGGTFYTEARKNRIDRFKCSACHGNKEVMIQNAAKISHADIVITHGQKDGPENCNTCHDPNNRDSLISTKGEPIDMDHAYEMCGQCHFRQKKDWVGGAHGKRVTFWAGKRVVQNCTSCHNPHSPRFEKRMPATYSVPLK